MNNKTKLISAVLLVVAISIFVGISKDESGTRIINGHTVEAAPGGGKGGGKGGGNTGGNTISVSNSKLGIHFLGIPSGTASSTNYQVLDACPRVVKWILNPYTASEIDYYKSKCSGGIIILRAYIPSTEVKYTVNDDPIASADDYWIRMISQSGASAINPDMVDWLEGPNEADVVPYWYNDLEAANWVAQFWSRLSDLMNQAGYKPLVGSLVAGQPASEDELYPGSPNLFQPIADEMKTKNYNWGWSYHPYTLAYSTNTQEEGEYALYYRKIISEVNLKGVPLVLTEGGYWEGWKNKATADEYFNWLVWFDSQIKKDRDVVGLTIFQLGNQTDWDTFDLTPLVPSLINYW